MNRTRALGLLALCAIAYLIGSQGCTTEKTAAPLSQAQLSEPSSPQAEGDPLNVFGGIPSVATTTPQRRAEKATFRPDEELWIIEKPSSDTPGDYDPRRDDIPGSGALVVELASREQVPVPLKHTEVKAQISGYIATVNVTQEFHNPFDEKIEAVYVFPLPVNAAVNDFLMTIGERRIRGIIREREEARRIYLAARAQGKVASLLTQERPNIFTQKVANIEPGKEIDVDIKYFHTLRYVDGSYEFVFPMVVGPRFNPPGMTAGVGAVAREGQDSSGQATEVSYLRPEERSGHDIALTAEIDAGVAIEEIASPSHVVTKRRRAPEKVTVALARNDRIPNRDFVLRYRVAGERVKASLLTHQDERGGFFTLMLYPPREVARVERSPMELIFVLDCSGSMSGAPLLKAKQGVARALKRLQEGDTFQVIRFSVTASQLGSSPLLATPENVRCGLDYLESLESSGGTMMSEGIKAALDFPHDGERLRVVAFLTDGYIGNEPEIFSAVEKRLRGARIFGFGVGSSVNRHLLEGLARLGEGAVAYVGLDESAAEVVDLFYERISHPALSRIEIAWAGLRVRDVYPRRIPDLIVGRPVVLTGRFDDPTKETSIQARGDAGGEEREIAVPVSAASGATHPGIPSVWARKRIAVLMDDLLDDATGELPQRITQVALEYNLVSDYTAFVAVDARSQTSGAHGTTVPVPVPVPAGVRYTTTVRE